MTDSVVILPSPLLPATAYERLAEGLRSAGAEARIADPAPVSSSGYAVDRLVADWAADAAEADLLVAHSNAGLVAPLVRSSSGGPARIVFVDAALLPDSGGSRLAPEPLREMLAGLADDEGVLPPWTRWWSQETVRGVIPAELFDLLDRSCPRLPAAYFDQRVDAPHGWAAAANAYLAFGDTYADELGFARAHAWPSNRLDGGHLHFLHEPDLVADHVLALASALTGNASA